MKNLLLTLFIFTAAQAQAYTKWSDYTPSVIFTEVPLSALVTRKIIIRTKGMVNSCSGLFEGNKFRAKLIDCSSNGELSIKIEFKNKVNCDQGMSYTKKLKLKLPKACLDSFDFDQSRVIINDKIFESH